MTYIYVIFRQLKLSNKPEFLATIYNFYISHANAWKGFEKHYLFANFSIKVHALAVIGKTGYILLCVMI
jgi:hypothetical protein